jgi:membrane-bound metal-dependent hydrolase YbcI (DUF457 family)
MDFFTHLLIGLIVASLADGQNIYLYTALAVFMSLLSDLDFAMFPLWKWFPSTGHHGITHTPIFVFAASAVIYAAITIFTGTSDIEALLVMLLAGSLHIFGDFLGTGGVPLLYPFSWRYFKLNIDLGIDTLLMLFSIAGIAVLFRAYLNYPYFPDARSASILLGSLFILYYATRGALKLYQEHKPENMGFTALPTKNPFKWKYARRIETKEDIKIFLKTSEGVKTFTIPKDRRERIEKCEDLVYTYWNPQVQGEMRFFEYPCYKVICQEGRKEIVWNSAESGKVIEVQVTIEEGHLRVDKRFRSKKILWP